MSESEAFDKRLLELAIAQKPCAQCNDPGCEMSRLVLYASEYKYLKTDERGLAIWGPKP